MPFLVPKPNKLFAPSQRPLAVLMVNTAPPATVNAPKRAPALEPVNLPLKASNTASKAISNAFVIPPMNPPSSNPLRISLAKLDAPDDIPSLNLSILLAREVSLPVDFSIDLATSS